MSIASETPKVWIGCLASYNEGTLHGKWVEATDAGEIQQAGEEVIKTSRADFPEELFIADYDNFPRGAVSQLGEYPDYETVAKIGRMIEEHGAPFAAYLEVSETDLDDLSEDEFEEHYRGEWISEEAYAEETISDLGWAGVERIPNSLMPYLDMELIAQELFRHGNYSSHPAPGGKVYVFEDEV